MTSTEESLTPQKRYDNSSGEELSAAIEKVRSQFPPEMQNTLGVLIAARQPISTKLLSEFASNHDGHGAGNPVKVEEVTVSLLIQVLKEAEQRFGVKLLEEAPIHTINESRPDGSAAVMSDSALRETAMGYKMVEAAGLLIEERYPDLYVEFNKMFANRMLFDLGLGEEQPARNDLIPATDNLGLIVDGTAQKMLPLR